MVAEYRVPAHAPQRSRAHIQKSSFDYLYSPDAAALRVTIQALWRKGRRVGYGVPLDELCLNLETLDIESLCALKARIRLRLTEQMGE